MKSACDNCFVCLNKVIGINNEKNAKMLTSAKLIFGLGVEFSNPPPNGGDLMFCWYTAAVVYIKYTQFSSQLGLDNILFKFCRYSSASSDLDFQMSKSCRSSVVSVGLRPLKSNRVLNL